MAIACMVLIRGSLFASSRLFIAGKERPASSARALWLKRFAVLNRLTFWASICKFMVASFLCFSKIYHSSNFCQVVFLYGKGAPTLPGRLR
ncbi:hypothetical protein TRIP_B130003 [uncultured Desulfatiglans sp.]|nr:hypothetical protein TRIP_B130003 [uncultured Desulfatiglans sp.]